MRPFDLKRPTVPLWKDFNPVINIVSAQEISSILKIGFALSKSPNIRRAYLVSVCNQQLLAELVQKFTKIKNVES